MSMKYKLKITILSVLWVVLINCTNGQETKILKKDSVSIEYPIDWVNRDMTGYLLLVSEPAGKEQTLMSTFDIQIGTNFKTVDEFFNDYKKKMTNNETFKDFKIKSKKKISYKGHNAVEYNCTATAQDLPLEWRSIIFLKDNKVYKLTTTSLIGRFNLLKKKTEKIFNSFKIE